MMYTTSRHTAGFRRGSMAATPAPQRRPSTPRLVMSREATPLSAGGIEARILSSAEWAIYDYELPERPTFVWLGPASTEIHLSAIAPPLLELNRRNPRCLTRSSCSTQKCTGFPSPWAPSSAIVAWRRFWPFIKENSSKPPILRKAMRGACLHSGRCSRRACRSSVKYLSTRSCQMLICSQNIFGHAAMTTGALPADRVAPVPELVRSGA